MSFSSRLKNAMNEREVSQAELAGLIGKNKSSVSQYISGKNIPKDDVVAKIAEVLNCTTEYLKEDVPEGDTSTYGIHNVSVSQAAKKLGKSAQFVRVALQRGTAPFGFAVQNKTHWSYHISPKKLDEYIGTY